MRQVTVHHDMADTVNQVHGVTSVGNLRDTEARCLEIHTAHATEQFTEGELVIVPWDRILLIEDEGPAS